MNTSIPTVTRNPRKWLPAFTLTAKSIITLLLLSLSYLAIAQNVQNKEYHHWANGGTVKTDNEWINGALQQTNSHWAEGDEVPHVYTPDTKGWSNGPRTIVVYYDYARTVSGTTTGGFFAFIDNFAPPAGYYGEAAAAAGALYATSNVSNVTLSDLTDAGSGTQTIKRKQISFTYTSDGNPVAIYFGLKLALASDGFDQGAGSWPGASLQTSLNGNGARTLSINLGEAVNCSKITPSISGGTSVCKNDASPSVTFSASGGTPPYTFEYTVNDGPSQYITTDPGESSVSISVSTSSAGTYTYALVSVAGQFCSNEAEGSTTVTIKDISSTPTVSSSTITVCQGDAAPLLTNYVTGSNLLWYSTASSNDGSSTPPTVSTATAGSSDYYVSQTETGQCESGRVKITVKVNGAPRCSSSPNVSNATAEVGQPVTFTATETQNGNLYSYKWTISGNSAGAYFDGQLSGVTTLTTSTAGVVVKTTTTGSYTLSLEVTNTETNCKSIATNCSNTITVNASAKYTTYTKGFWGNLGGKFCGSSDANGPLNAMKAALGDSKQFGTGGFSFTLYKAVFTNTGTTTKPVYQIYQLLPGGSTPAVLKGDGSSTPKIGWGNVTIDLTSGSITNNLLAQGIAMFFNKSYDAAVGSAVLYGNKLTFTASNACASGSTTQVIPLCVYNAAKDAEGKVTVESIYNVAMAVLGGGNKNISAPDANAALNALNVGFDKGAKITGVTMDNTACSVIKPTVNATKIAPESLVLQTLTVSAAPNPFTDKIRFTIQAPQAGRATLEVYNLLGQKVGVPFEGQLNAGETRNVEYTAPLNFRSNLIYLLRMNGEQVSGKLMSTKQ